MFIPKLIRRKVVRDKLMMYHPDYYRPVIRTQYGTEILYRWNWWGLFDRKIKTVWQHQKDWGIQ